ncbi:MAG: Gfo/Idh/MocA family oxidoreductase, partial [Verrucomicrobia bacterium]|nr:Gfo/Idh/MocA family oxidoreductase [Verrucomicrobiota bacterium]
HRLNKPTEIRRAGMPGSPSEETSTNIRLPAGHTAGFMEAFANLYRAFAEDIYNVIANTPNPTPGDYPSVREGINGIRFIEAVVKSSHSKDKWVKV